MEQMTATQKGKIKRELKHHLDPTTRMLPIEACLRIASRHRLPSQSVIDYAGDLGYQVQMPSARGEKPQRPAPANPHNRLSDHIKRQIIRGTIYRTVNENGQEPDDGTIVVTTYGQVRRQQEALLIWLHELGVSINDL